MTQSAHKNPSILIVDDDRNIRKMLNVYLRRTGYELKEAANGREALEAMRSDEPSLVLLDLMMPEVSGWDVLDERAKEADLQKIPVIVITASRGERIPEVLDKGICALLPKPFELNTLTALVRSCLEPAEGDSQPQS